MQRQLLMDVVVAESTAVLELLAEEYQALLIWWDAASRLGSLIMSGVMQIRQ